MAVAPEWVVKTYRSRRTACGSHHARMSELRHAYNGEIFATVPELDLAQKAMTANLVTQGLDQLAMRIASVTPSVMCPPLRRGIKRSEDYARVRRLAILSWWEHNHFPVQLSQRARWLIGYATAPVMIRPDQRKQIPMWQVLDPFCVFPGPSLSPLELCPPDCIIAYTRPLSWLRENYPTKLAGLALGADTSPDATFEVLEYVDDSEHVLLVIGKPEEETRQSSYGPQRDVVVSGASWSELARFENRLGKCPVVVPKRVVLDRPQGQFDGMPAIAKMHAQTMALWQVSNERSIFPEVWAISRPNEQVQIVQIPDGREGIPGEIKGGDIKELTIAPPPQVGQFIDLLERNQRVTAGISPDFGGEAPTNVRTGRAGDQLLSATVDYWIQEAHTILGESYRHENDLAIRVAREYFGNVKKSFYVTLGKGNAPVDYIPKVHFETEANTVAWPNAGSDANSLAIGIGQRIGIQEMSIRTAQELDPYIDDPELEHERLVNEGVEKALLASIDQAVATGQLGPLEIARLQAYVGTNRLTLADAFEKIHEDMQEQQANSQQSPEQGGPQPGSPEAQPGMMSPGQQQMLGVGPANPPGGGVPTPAPSIQHLGSLFSSLRGRTDVAPQQ